jgi:natural product biosynthesis luciferase-like monooxygenase protein
MRLSLFYFADDAAADSGGDGYRLLMDGARFADAHGFEAVWTPERHFHRFGGRYPNPAVTGAAVAATTHRVGIRAGSVVGPLHHVLRIAEEWSVVDNISGGRVGVSLASGGSRGDFVLRPEAYPDRQERTEAAVDRLRRLWTGEPYREGDATYEVYPRPVQTPPPLWLTCGGRPGGFQAAGRAGTAVLTHLMNQTRPELAERLTEYRAARTAAGHPGTGHVTLMVHTYLDEDMAAVRAAVTEPFQRYLMSALNLFQSGKPTAGDGRDRLAVRPAFERYLREDGLFGNVGQAEAALARYRAAGVDEVACLIDFGLPIGNAWRGLERLAELNEIVNARGWPGSSEAQEVLA